MKAHVMMKGIACVSTWLAVILQLAAAADSSRSMCSEKHAFNLVMLVERHAGAARAGEVDPFYFTDSSCGSIVMMIDLRS